MRHFYTKYHFLATRIQVKTANRSGVEYESEKLQNNFVVYEIHKLIRHHFRIQRLRKLQVWPMRQDAGLG